MLTIVKGEIDRLVAGEQLSPESLAGVLDKVAIAKDMIADVEKLAKAQARDQLDKGIELPNYRLTKGRTNRSVPDPIALREELKQAGHDIEPSIWYANCKMGITELKSLLKEQGLKGKALDKVIDETENIKTSVSAPILKRR